MHLPFVGRCLGPRVAIVNIADLVTIFLAQGTSLVVLSELGLGDAFAGVEVGVAHIPGMTDVFLDEVSVNLGELKVLIDNARRQVAISQSEARDARKRPKQRNGHSPYRRKELPCNKER